MHGLVRTIHSGEKPKQAVVLAGAFATLLGAFVRLAPAVAAGFPVNDGGLFYTFTLEIQAAGFRLPYFSGYNHAAIPFLYPPLSFYLTGLLSSLTGISVLDLVRFLPPLISIATVPVFFFLARRLMKDGLSVAAATIAYALLPTAFDFMIVGGGLPRALGIFFCLLTLYCAAGLLGSGRRSGLIGAAAFAGLTVLSHPVVAWFMAYSLAVIFAFQRASRRALRDLLLAAAIAAALTSPWWGTGIARHGLEPFLAVLQAGQRSWSAVLAPFLFLQTNELYLALLAVFSLLGLFLSLRRRQFVLPAWLATVFVLEPRLTATYAAIPTALLAGIGYAGVVLPALSSRRDVPSAQREEPSAEPHAQGPSAQDAPGWAAALATGYFVCYLLVAAFLAAPKDALPQAQREAMDWVRTNTPADSQFIVLSGIGEAGVDYVSEWFPALADRVSVATPQGYEWFPGRAFNRRWELHSDLQACGDQDVRCLETWADRARAPFTHVYLVRDLPGTTAAEGAMDLYQSLLGSPEYEQVLSRAEVSVFALRPAP